MALTHHSLQTLKKNILHFFLSTNMAENDFKQCEETISSFLQSLKLNKQLNQTIINSKLLLKCSVCSSNGIEGNSQAYLEINPLQITLCVNRIKKKNNSYEKILKHELIHAYDYINQRYNLHTCNGLAYSEVRAAKVGECSDYFIHDYFKNKCIKDHAIRSTAVSYLYYSFKNFSYLMFFFII